jgi:hypothetical protein
MKARAALYCAGFWSCVAEGKLPRDQGGLELSARLDFPAGGSGRANLADRPTRLPVHSCGCRSAPRLIRHRARLCAEEAAQQLRVGFADVLDFGT